MLIYLLLLPSVISQIQINLRLIEPIIQDENLQHDCFYTFIHIKNETKPYHIISYCLSENYHQSFKLNKIISIKILL